MGIAYLTDQTLQHQFPENIEELAYEPPAPSLFGVTYGEENGDVHSKGETHASFAAPQKRAQSEAYNLRSIQRVNCSYAAVTSKIKESV